MKQKNINMIKMPSLDILKEELPIKLSKKDLNQLEKCCNFIGILKRSS